MLACRPIRAGDELILAPQARGVLLEPYAVRQEVRNRRSSVAQSLCLVFFKNPEQSAQFSEDYRGTSSGRSGSEGRMKSTTPLSVSNVGTILAPP